MRSSSAARSHFPSAARSPPHSWWWCSPHLQTLPPPRFARPVGRTTRRHGHFRSSRRHLHGARSPVREPPPRPARAALRSRARSRVVAAMAPGPSCSPHRPWMRSASQLARPLGSWVCRRSRAVRRRWPTGCQALRPGMVEASRSRPFEGSAASPVAARPPPWAPAGRPRQASPCLSASGATGPELARSAERRRPRRPAPSPPRARGRPRAPLARHAEPGLAHPSSRG